MVVDENKENQLIYFQGDENYKEGIYKAYIEDSVQSGKTSYIFSTSGSFVNGWKLISGIQSSELNAQKISIGTLISIMILILFWRRYVCFSYHCKKNIYAPEKAGTNHAERGGRHTKYYGRIR